MTIALLIYPAPLYKSLQIILAFYFYIQTSATCITLPDDAVHFPIWINSALWPLSSPRLTKYRFWFACAVLEYETCFPGNLNVWSNHLHIHYQHQKCIFFSVQVKNKIKISPSLFEKTYIWNTVRKPLCLISETKYLIVPIINLDWKIFSFLD